MKSFKISLLPLKETFVDALNTVTFTATIKILCLPKRGGSSETEKLILSQKRKSFLLEITAKRDFWYELIVVHISNQVLYKNT